MSLQPFARVTLSTGVQLQLDEEIATMAINRGGLMAVNEYGGPDPREVLINADHIVLIERPYTWDFE